MATEIVEPSLVPNTTMNKYINSSGVFIMYRLKAIDGYVLHDRDLDYVEYEDEVDPDTGELVEVSRTKGYSAAEMSVGAAYDFTPIQMTDEQGNVVTAYGERELFAVPQTDVPSNQIFGSGDNNHEVM